ncbi:MAG: hypothetical protein FJ279_36010, partial [Planctomycetes bacterium]|nr:hypothetical protein [Planctomycetota bacterium]
MISDPIAGFLPPNDDTHRGEGFVSFVVRPKGALPTGTEIRNQARIVFDLNAPIDTNETLNTIDAAAPTTEVQDLPAVSAGDRSFTVSWTGGDDLGGSGLVSYDVYVSDNGGPAALWLGGTTATSATFTGQHNHTYGFYSLGLDEAGNRQLAPEAAQATTTVLDTVAPRVTALARTPNAIAATFHEDLDAATVNTATFKVSSAAGLDRLWGTADDTYIAGVVAYDADADTATFTPAEPFGAGPYGVWLDGTTSITDLAGNKLDGEFAGAFPSGDGTPGGDFVASFLPAVTLRRGGVIKAQYRDWDGDTFNLAFGGAGSATIAFQTGTARGADIDTITFADTTAKTTLTSRLVKSASVGDRTTTLNGITAPQHLGTLDFAATSVLGNVTLGGGIKSFLVGRDLGRAGDATVAIAGAIGSKLKVGGRVASAVTVGAAVGSVDIGGVLNAGFVAADTIKSFKAGSMGENAALESTNGSILKVQTLGDLTGQVFAGQAIGSVDVKGNIQGGIVAAGGGIGSVKATGEILDGSAIISGAGQDGLRGTADDVANANMGAITARAISGILFSSTNIASVSATGGNLNADIQADRVG